MSDDKTTADKKSDIASAIEEISQAALTPAKRCSACRGLRHTPDGVRCTKCRGSGIEHAAKGLAGGIDRVDIKK